jgi:gamma-glutamyltranspeptidase
VLERGGNIVDAAIAVAFALGVVEPDASGLGGDGQAVLFLKGMTEPTVIEYKDQTPAAATLDNPRIFLNGRLVGDGPMAANIPGLVAGLDYLHSQYGNGRVSWSDLIEPAIRQAENGFVLDHTLPSTIAEGRQVLDKYSASARLFLPNRQVPKAGDRFVNRDLATTLRTLAREGADSFYRGSLAQRIAADMVANGGLITTDDLAQYRAIERKPVSTALPRSRSLHGRTTGCGRYFAARGAIGARKLPRARACDRHDGCRLLALPDRSVEGARPHHAHRRPGTVDRRVRATPGVRTCRRSVPSHQR